MDFDALRAAVVPGAGIVGRWPGVICVAECADRHVLRQLLDVCAGAVGGEPGRTLARRLAGWLGGPDAPGEGLRFGTVAVTGGDTRARGEQWAVFLYGPVGLVVPDRQVALSGAQSVAWTDRLLPRPDAPVVLALEGGPIPPGVVDGVHDLRMGVVPATGAVLVPGGGGTSGEVADEPGRTRPDDRWPEANGPERPRWDGESLPTSSPEVPYHGESPGNGVPNRGSLGAIDGFGGYEGGESERSASSGSGRAHLRPVPSGTNGVAHRGWVPRRGSSLDNGRDQDVGSRRAADDDTTDAGARPDRVEPRLPGPPPHDEPRPPEITAPGLGDEHHDTGHRNGRNGVRTNGATYGLLGGAAEALPRETERSPWSDGRDAGRPDRIEGWFATRDDAGTESDLGAVGPAELRRRRHGRPEDDAAGDDEPAAEMDAGGADDGDLGAAVGDYGTPDYGTPDYGTSTADDHDTGEFGTGAGEDLGAGVEHAGDLDRRAAQDGEGRGLEGQDLGSGFGSPDVDGGTTDGGDLDGAGDGTPKLGVPRMMADGASEPEPVQHQGAEPDAPHTTALRSERILGVAPGEPERSALDDGPATGGLVVDDHQQVSGYLCARGHLNDPRAQYCAQCGASIEEQAGPPAPGRRPPLGLLVFDDGATYTVDAEYLMGRMPEADPRVVSGTLRSLALEDTSGAVSRVHAQIIVNGWDALLVDAGSRNGTFVSPPGEQGWTQLPAGETHRLLPGTRVRIGGRTFQFESPSGAL